MNKSTIFALITGLLVSVGAHAQSMATSSSEAMATDYVSLEDYQSGSSKEASFEVKADSSLREVLSQWAEQAGWQKPEIKIADDVDYILGSSHTFVGDFPSALAQLRLSLGGEASTLKFKISRGSKVLTVTEGDL